MMDVSTPKRLVAQLDDARLLSAKPLSGGVSAVVTLLEIERQNGQHERLILRCHQGENASEKADSESALLHHLSLSGLPVAAVHMTAAPCLLLDFIEGATVFKPDNLNDFIDKSAAMLAHIHGHEGVESAQKWVAEQADFDVNRALKSGDNRADKALEKRILDALKGHPSAQKRNPFTLLHGDFWAGNLIWKGDTIAGIIDWEDAAWGDPLADLAVSRLEFALAFGADAARLFTESYRQAVRFDVDFADLARWDLRAALRPIGHFSAWAAGWPALGRADVTAAVMRERHLNFTLAALDRL